ncbi:MAG: NUDIX hydrolase [Chloroflexota bacterium]
MPEPWPLVQTRPGPSYRIFSLRIDTARAPHTGKEHDFYIIDSPDWVNIIPLTQDNQVVMVRQFRHGIKELTLEIPGGMVEKGDNPEDAARRELLEETGYQAKTMSFLGVVHPNPAILTNRCFTYLAHDLEKINGGNFDETEDIEIVLIPITQIPTLTHDGTITHSLVVAAFFWYFLNPKINSREFLF